MEGVEEVKQVRLTDGALTTTLPLQADTTTTNIVNALSKVFPSRTPVSVIVHGQAVSLEKLFDSATNNNTPPYRINFRVQLLPPPALHSYTLCELNCELIAVASPRDENFSRYLEHEGVHYPHIVVSPDNPSKQDPVHLRRDDGILTRFLENSGNQPPQKKRKRGEEQLKTQERRNFPWSWFPSWGRLVKESPSLEPKGPAIKCFAWHQHKNVFAIALADDTVKTYDLTTERWYDVQLSHSFQKEVVAMEWKPNSGAVLALGCSNGICLWQMISRSPHTVVPHGAWMRFLSRPDHAPITALAWSPDGQYLASSSMNNDGILIWDVVLGVCTPLTRVSEKIGLLRWSPTGCYLFSATMNGGFRVWETMSWSSQYWSFSKPCQTATWAGDGNLLLVVEQGESRIHAIRFNKEPPLIDGQYEGVEDVGPMEVVFQGSSEQSQVGGPIKQMEWDKTAQRLAVTFVPSESNGGELISLFATNTQYPLSYTHRGFIRGPSAIPLHMGFSSCFSRGALLAVCWDNGKISFYPLLFNETQ